MSVPYITRQDEFGQDFLDPALPEGWAWEQASSALDTGRWANPNKKLAVVNVLTDRAIVEAWMERQNSRDLVKVFDLTQDFLTVRERARTDPGALKEYRQEYKNSCKSFIRNQEAKEATKRTVKTVLPFIAVLGLAGAASYFGIPVAALAAVVCREKFSDTDGTELHGKSPDTTDVDGATWYNDGAHNNAGVAGTGFLTVYNNTDTGIGNVTNAYIHAIYNGSNYGDSYVQANGINSPLGRSGPSIRWTVSTHTGYSSNGLSNRDMWRQNSRTSRTRIANDTFTTTVDLTAGTNYIRLEAVGSDITMYEGASDPADSVVGTVSDATYATGTMGWHTYSNNAYFNASLGGLELGTVGGAPTTNLVPWISQLFRRHRN